MDARSIADIVFGKMVFIESLIEMGEGPEADINLYEFIDFYAEQWALESGRDKTECRNDIQMAFQAEYLDLNLFNLEHLNKLHHGFPTS